MNETLREPNSTMRQRAYIEDPAGCNKALFLTEAHSMMPDPNTPCCHVVERSHILDNFGISIALSKWEIRSEIYPEAE